MKDERRVVLSFDERHKLVADLVHNTQEMSMWPDKVMNDANRALDLKSPVVRFRGYLPSKRRQQYSRVLHEWVSMQHLSDAQIAGLHKATQSVRGRRR